MSDIIQIDYRRWLFDDAYRDYIERQSRQSFLEAGARLALEREREFLEYMDGSAAPPSAPQAEAGE